MTCPDAIGAAGGGSHASARTAAPVPGRRVLLDANKAWIGVLCAAIQGHIAHRRESRRFREHLSRLKPSRFPRRLSRLNQQPGSARASRISRSGLRRYSAHTALAPATDTRMIRQSAGILNQSCVQDSLFLSENAVTRLSIAPAGRGLILPEQCGQARSTGHPASTRSLNPPRFRTSLNPMSINVFPARAARPPDAQYSKTGRSWRSAGS
jgi:hypothetical protein